MANKLCQRCFHSYVCEQFNEHRNSTVEYTRCHFYNDHFVDADSVVPVVRCKDCEYFIKAEVNGNGFLICSVTDKEIFEEDFCSYGERRDSNG